MSDKIPESSNINDAINGTNNIKDLPTSSTTSANLDSSLFLPHEVEKQRLKDQVNRLKIELKSLKDEKEETESRASNLSSTLKYNKLALEGQKLLYDMQTRRLNECERENLELKQAINSLEVMVKNYRERILKLETAFQEDVTDKNAVVATFNNFMLNTQKRITELFEMNNTVSVNKKYKTAENDSPSASEILQPELSSCSDSNGIFGSLLNATGSCDNVPNDVSKLTTSSNIEKPDSSEGQQKRKELLEDSNDELRTDTTIQKLSINAEVTDSSLKKKQRYE